jgi:hypothetical protein
VVTLELKINLIVFCSSLRGGFTCSASPLRDLEIMWPRPRASSFAAVQVKIELGAPEIEIFECARKAIKLAG